jgi:hypothetical protein
MRLVSFSAAILLALSSVAQAQQSPGTTGDTIGHPPPLPDPSTPQAAPAASTAKPNEPAKGYLGAYGPPGPPTPYSTGPLPQYTGGPGLNVAGPDGDTRSVRAVPCTRSARETDGFTTCVGIPESSMKRRR